MLCYAGDNRARAFPNPNRIDSGWMIVIVIIFCESVSSVCVIILWVSYLFGSFYLLTGSVRVAASAALLLISNRNSSMKFDPHRLQSTNTRNSPATRRRWRPSLWFFFNGGSCDVLSMDGNRPDQ